MKSLLKRLSALTLSLVLTVVCLSVSVKADEDTFEEAAVNEIETVGSEEFVVDSEVATDTEVDAIDGLEANNEIGAVNDLETNIEVDAAVPETDAQNDVAVIDNSNTPYETVLASAEFPTAVNDIRVDVNAVVGKKGLSFDITVPASGLYKLGINYKGEGEDNGDFVFGLKVDDNYPFSEAKELNLFRIFCDEPGGNRKDAQGNEFSPRQIHYDGFFYDEVTDVTRWTDDEYLFALSEGEHTITLDAVEGSFKIDYVVFGVPEVYENYTAPADKSEYYQGDDVIIEGENARLKTGYWLQSKADNSSLDVSPNDAYKVLANYIGGGTWKTSGQTITWETPEVKAGYYALGFSFRQSTILGAKVYRKLRIDGKVPFAEAAQVGFPYSYKWEQNFFADKNSKPYLIYLSEGKHEISLEITAGEITEVRNLLKDAVTKLGDLYVDITMITGETVDIYRDYDLFMQIGDMQDRLSDIAEVLGNASKQLQIITGEKSGSYISIINNMQKIAELMIENKYTAHRYKDEYYSKYTSLASVLYEISDMPLDIDKMSLVAPGSEKPFETAGFFDDVAFSIEKFFVSFTQDYNNLSNAEDGKNSITIWVNWGRDQAQVLDSLIQSDFTQKTGISVNVQLVNATVVQAVLSGKGPDCLLQHSRSEPVNLAMRGMLYNLKEFDDCDEVLKYFHKGAELPYYYKGGLYGLPDTQSFYLMFYRTDIFEEMDLKVPKTWDDFKETVKLITRKNLTAWMPNNTATSTAQANIGIGSINLFPTFLVQQNLEVYAADGRSTNLTDSDVIVSFGKWTDFYTKLKLPRTMNFYNRFRTGTCPIGIDTYTLYTTLKAAAPEIRGLWNVSLVPGTVMDDGSVSHATTGGGTACSILNLTKNPKAAWEFLKWWVSKDTQLAYSSEVESILGPTGRIALANVEAFKSLQWDADMKDVITTAMGQIKEIPEYPGSYYVSRSVYQAFWNVVENKQNTKKTLLKFAEEADEEIARKWHQYENR